MEIQNEDDPRDAITLYLVENYPYLVSDTLLETLISNGLVEIFGFIVAFFNERDLWRSKFQKTSTEVLTELFVSSYITQHITANSAACLSVFKLKNYTVNTKFRIQPEHTDETQMWSAFDKFTAKFVWRLKSRLVWHDWANQHLGNSMKASFDGIGILKELFNHGVHIDEPYVGFELLHDEWPSSQTPKTLLNFCILLRIRNRHRLGLFVEPKVGLKAAYCSPSHRQLNFLSSIISLFGTRRPKAVLRSSNNLATEALHAVMETNKDRSAGNHIILDVGESVSN